MGKWFAGLLVCVALLAEPDPLRAEDDGIVSARELLVSCTSDWGNMAYLEMYASCRAYISGVADILASGASIGKMSACFHETTTKGMLTEAAIKRMRVDPQRNSGNAARLVARALAREFPCN